MTEAATHPPSAATAAPSIAGVLAGRRLLVTGVLTPKSIGYAIASRCQAAGASVVLTSFGRAMGLTGRTAQRLSPPPPVLEMDVTDEEQVGAATAEAARTMGGLDGAVHAVAFAPPDCFSGNFLHTPWESVRTAVEVSSYSMKTLAAAVAPHVGGGGGGSLVALSFDASVAWPLYDWMGPAKAALEAVVRYLARDLGPRGIRVNSLSAGPLETMAARSIPGFDALRRSWSAQAPLGWESDDAGPVADAAVFLLSDMARGVTGELLHVDGGYHAMGAPPSRTVSGPEADGTTAGGAAPA